MNKTDKTDISLEVSFSKLSLSPLSLYRKLHSKGNNPINPINSPTVEITTAGTHKQLMLPDTAPAYDPECHHELAGYYGSRPRAERLQMHQRAAYIRADKGWPWDICDCIAFDEHLNRTGAKPPFILAGDWFVDRSKQP